MMKRKSKSALIYPLILHSVLDDDPDQTPTKCLTLGKNFLIMSGETDLIGLASSSSTEAVIALSLILAFFQGSE